MNKKPFVFKSILLLLLLVIVGNQIFWIVNMYNSYQQELVLNIDRAIEKAIYIEVMERFEGEGGFFFYGAYTEDSIRFVQREIITEDSTFLVTIDRQDPNANLKIAQYGLKDIIPVDVDRLNQIFYEQLQTSHFSITNTYIEYYDLEKDILLDSNNPNENFTSYISSALIPMDIIESIGVKAYVGTSMLTILNHMIFQLALSILLISIAIIGLFVLGRTIYTQWRLEAMQRDAINSMTHEFKRPISTALSYASLIPYYLEKNKPEKIISYSDNTVRELNKLTVYTEQIQHISNNDKATLQLTLVIIEFKTFFEQLCKKYLPSEEGTIRTSKIDKPIDIQIRIETPRTGLCVDSLHFSNVLDNLIENAIKYSGETVSITLSVKEQNGWLFISVSDNGFGISSKDRKYIFDRYFRGENSNHRAGFGLGLTYVKTVVNAHSGKIEVYSEPGKGSEFIIMLPV